VGGAAQFSHLVRISVGGQPAAGLRRELGVSGRAVLDQAGQKSAVRATFAYDRNRPFHDVAVHPMNAEKQTLLASATGARYFSLRYSFRQNRLCGRLRNEKSTASRTETMF